MTFLSEVWKEEDKMDDRTFKVSFPRWSRIERANVVEDCLMQGL